MDPWQAIRWRLFGRCWAQGCDKRMWRHTPSAGRRCADEPLAVELTDRGWLHSNGIDPDSEPVVPVSRAS